MQRRSRGSTTHYNLSGDVSVDLGRKARPGQHIITASAPDRRQTLTLRNANSRSRFGILTPTPAQLIVHLNPRLNDGRLRLLLGASGGTVDEAIIRAEDPLLTSVDILTCGPKSHVDINMTSALSRIRIRGEGTNYLDFDFKPLIGGSETLRIDARETTGTTAVFVGRNYTHGIRFQGGIASTAVTQLGLQVTGAPAVLELEQVQTLILQRGSQGNLDLQATAGIHSVEVQRLGSRPGEGRLFSTLLNLPGLRSILFIGSGTGDSQDFPGLVISGLQTLPGPADRVQVNYGNRDIRLRDGSGLSHADPLRLDGVERLQLDPSAVIGREGPWTLAGLAGDRLQEVVLRNPSLGQSDLGTVSAGNGQGSLQRLDASAVAGPLRLRIAADSLAPGATVLGGPGGVEFDWVPGAQDGPLSVFSGDGDDAIVFGGTRQTIHSGLGRDRFRQVAANGGRLDALTTIAVADPGTSDDGVELLRGGVNDQVSWLPEPADAADFLQTVRHRLEANPGASGLYAGTLLQPSGPLTLAYLHCGMESLDHLFAFAGQHNPRLQGTVLSLS
ncbi:MAG: hypothetical protein VKK62_09070 [Synechococcaceae cyanobacterium]|nr:hypothetical protein [Synechococcaceae cyanobacterium]